MFSRILVLSKHDVIAEYIVRMVDEMGLTRSHHHRQSIEIQVRVAEASHFLLVVEKLPQMLWRDPPDGRGRRFHFRRKTPHSRGPAACILLVSEASEGDLEHWWNAA